MPGTGFYIVADSTEETTRRREAEKTPSRLPAEMLEAFGLAGSSDRQPAPVEISQHALFHVKTRSEADDIGKFLRDHCDTMPLLYNFEIGIQCAKDLDAADWIRHDLEIDVSRRAVSDSAFDANLSADESVRRNLFSLAAYASVQINRDSQTDEQRTPGTPNNSEQPPRDGSVKENAENKLFSLFGEPDAQIPQSYEALGGLCGCSKTLISEIMTDNPRLKAEYDKAKCRKGKAAHRQQDAAGAAAVKDAVSREPSPFESAAAGEMAERLSKDAGSVLRTTRANVRTVVRTRSQPNL